MPLVSFDGIQSMLWHVLLVMASPVLHVLQSILDQVLESVFSRGPV
jgi:hypothetical protein